MNKTLEKKLRYLRLSNLITNWDALIEKATEGDYSLVRFLKHVIDEEYKTRCANALLMRLKRARIPEQWRIETFPFHEQPRLNKKKVLAVYDAFDYMTKKRNVVWIGRTGVGKTGLATGFLLQAIDRGYSGRYVRFAELVAELYASTADHTQEKLLKRYASMDCLLVDEVGYVEVEKTQAGLFFALLQMRQGLRSTLITSNLGFSDWGDFLKNPHLTAALLDRLTQSSYIFNMRNCRSIRKPLDPEK